MIEQLKSIIESANPNYIVEFEENSMMNVKVDEYPLGAKFAYIEEYVSGRYFKEKYFNKKSIQIQIYFCQFTEMHNDAVQREIIRQQIEGEIISPFIELLNKSEFDSVNEFRFYTPLPRFDANEISIMLSFDLIMTKC